jgi:hypothetical protein
MAIASNVGPVTPDQLTTGQVAALAGIAPASVRRYRLRGTFPGPDGYVGRTPWWRRRTVERWLASRRHPGRPRIN